MFWPLPEEKHHFMGPLLVATFRQHRSGHGVGFKGVCLPPLLACSLYKFWELSTRERTALWKAAAFLPQRAPTRISHKRLVLPGPSSLSLSRAAAQPIFSSGGAGREGCTEVSFWAVTTWELAGCSQAAFLISFSYPQHSCLYQTLLLL